MASCTASECGGVAAIHRDDGSHSTLPTTIERAGFLQATTDFDDPQCTAIDMGYLGEIARWF
jgi:hypothetical protein